MVIVFALAAAVLYGSADFLGGAASRHSRALSVAVLSVPVGAAVASGEHLGVPVYAGAAVCLVATVLVSLERGTPSRPAANAPGSGFLAGHPALRGLVYGTVCGAMFGIFFVFLRNAGSSGVFWPVCTARLANSAVVIAVAVLAGARPVGREPGPPVRHRGRADLPVPGHHRAAGTDCAARADAGGPAAWPVARRRRHRPRDPLSTRPDPRFPLAREAQVSAVRAPSAKTMIRGWRGPRPGASGQARATGRFGNGRPAARTPGKEDRR